MSVDCAECVLTPVVMARAREISVTRNVTVLEGLQQVSGWPSEVVMVVLGAYLNIPVVTMLQLEGMNADFEVIPYTDCVQRGVFLAVDNALAHCLVLSDPFDGVAEGWALQRCARVGIVPRLALTTAGDLQACFSRQERVLRAMDGFKPEFEEHKDEDVAAVISLAAISEETSAVVKLVNSTIYDALKLQASDVHLECDAGCMHVLYRIDGILVPITQVQGRDTAEQVISRVKVMAELDIAERRIPQDGRFKVRTNGREVDFRVSVMPNIFGEDAVLRLLDRQSLTEQSESLRLDSLGLNADTIAAIRKLACKPHGMLLVTGPTGSGKTTTLYGAITEIHTGRDKIITIEDPVEYRLQRVLQIPVNEKKGLTFARGLRSILRHDPDKIMVGEIRDDETAQISVQAALTGHLVFTTVHANNVFDVVGRFLHMGVDPYTFASALNGIVAQRLLRMNCPHCTESVPPGADGLASLGLSAQDVAGWTFMAGRGCGHCRGAGYKGRKAVAEVLVLDDVLRELIADKAPVSVLKAHAANSGLKPLRETALAWVAGGATTLEEVARVAG